MEEEISLIELFSIIKKRFSLIIGLSLVGLILSAVFTFFIATPEYSATTQLLVNRTQTNEVIQQSDINTNLQLINTYKDIINGPVILDDVREELGLDMSHGALTEKIQVNNENNSQVFSLTVRDSNPYDAASIANTIANTFRDKIDNLMNVDNVSIISEAIPNENPVSPNTVVNLAIGLILGVMVGVGLSFMLEFLDTTVKDEKFITETLGLTNLGRISEFSEEDMKVTISQPKIERKASSRSVRSRV